ncbi:MAG: hypothetical protein CSA33_08810 [Desulfobulbus propionicus]|nr:MAG: hypothetical protein CSA33_08810 [Desulfobulbus propionicus]
MIYNVTKVVQQEIPAAVSLFLSQAYMWTMTPQGLRGDAVSRKLDYGPHLNYAINDPVFVKRKIFYFKML